MTTKRTRREVLASVGRAAAGASLGLLGARLARAQAPASKRLELGGDFHLLKAGAVNVLAVSTGDGLALVDGGPASESAALLKAAAALPGGSKIHTLFNTHWHPEQTGSNETLGKAGTTIVAQQNTRLWLTQDVTWPYEDTRTTVTAPAAARSGTTTVETTVKALPTVARPGKTFYTTLDLTLGGKHATCGYLRDCPHTDGDAYVYFKEDNVLAVGDAVYGTGAGWPWIDWWTGGWIGGIVGGLDTLMTIANPETRIVPARGAVLGLDDLKRQYDMYGAIWERLLKKLYAGGSPDEAVAAKPTQEFDDIMGPSEAFVRRAFKSLWAYLSPDA